MLPAHYEIPDLSLSNDLLTPLIAAHEVVTRLDERVRQASIGAGWAARSLFAEACACQLTEGDLVHLEDLVLLDAGSFSGVISMPLASARIILRTWRHGAAADAAALLRAERPGVGEAEPAPATAAFVAPERRPSQQHSEVCDGALVDVPRRDAWRRVWQQTRDLPPLLAAAIVWDAWLTLEPEAQSAWRAPLLAALTLRQRGLTNGWLVPIDTGRRHAPYRRHPAHSVPVRMAGFQSWVQTGAERGMNSLKTLTLANETMRISMKAKRKSSRLPELADLLISRPLVSAPTVAKALGITPQAVLRMVPQLGSVPREISGRTRYRVWSITAP